MIILSVLGSKGQTAHSWRRCSWCEHKVWDLAATSSILLGQSIWATAPQHWNTEVMLDNCALPQSRRWCWKGCKHLELSVWLVDVPHLELGHPLSWVRCQGTTAIYVTEMSVPDPLSDLGNPSTVEVFLRIMGWKKASSYCQIWHLSCFAGLAVLASLVFPW